MSNLIGGAAFPRPLAIDPNTNAVIWQQDGMSLRQYFAGQVIAGLVANVTCRANFDDRNLVDWSYQIADMMLAAPPPKGSAKT